MVGPPLAILAVAIGFGLAACPTTGAAALKDWRHEVVVLSIPVAIAAIAGTIFFLLRCALDRARDAGPKSRRTRPGLKTLSPR